MAKNAESAKIENSAGEKEKKICVLKEEIKKTTWAPKKTLFHQAGVVIVFTAALGLYIAAFDSIGKAIVGVFASLV